MAQILYLINVCLKKQRHRQRGAVQIDSQTTKDSMTQLNQTYHTARPSPGPTGGRWWVGWSRAEREDSDGSAGCGPAAVQINTCCSLKLCLLSELSRFDITSPLYCPPSWLTFSLSLSPCILPSVSLCPKPLAFFTHSASFPSLFKSALLKSESSYLLSLSLSFCSFFLSFSPLPRFQVSEPSFTRVSTNHQLFC